MEAILSLCDLAAKWNFVTAHCGKTWQDRNTSVWHCATGTG